VESQLVPERDNVDALVRPLRRHPRAVAHGLEQVADQMGEAMALEVLRERLEQVVLGRLLDVAGDEGDRGVLRDLDRGMLCRRAWAGFRRGNGRRPQANAVSYALFSALSITALARLFSISGSSI
jgi:hypothetical protein